MHPERLTDHEAHGDGLICFSLLNGLAERGHCIYAYTQCAPIHHCHPNLHVQAVPSRAPIHSLHGWEHALRADRWRRQLARKTPIDLVWRMHPYGADCPRPPETGSRPLVIGPLFYPWAHDPDNPPHTAPSRLGVSIQPFIRPIAQRGWETALQCASLLICATEPHSAAMQKQVSDVKVLTLPVIVEPPEGGIGRARHRKSGAALQLLFVANLVAYKRPIVFCEIIRRLRANGLKVQGTLLGDGPEREHIQSWCLENGFADAIHLVGKVPNTEVYRHMQKADALVSLSYGEPYGRSIVEAMSVGTPVICHRSGGPADFIMDGVDGLLVDELTAEAYVQVAGNLLNTPGLWETLSRNAAQKAQQWQSSVVLSRLESAFLEVCYSHA